MAARINGKKVAAGVTAVVALGSLSVAGVAAFAVGAAPTDKTEASLTTHDDGAAQDQGLSRDYDYGNENDDDGQINSGASPVQPGNGGAVSGQSAGS